MNMFRHNHIGNQAKLIFPPQFTKAIGDDLSKGVSAQERKAAMRAKCDETGATIMIIMAEIHGIKIDISTY